MFQISCCELKSLFFIRYQITCSICSYCVYLDSKLKIHVLLYCLCDKAVYAYLLTASIIQKLS